jgi:hypothetical protein
MIKSCIVSALTGLSGQVPCTRPDASDACCAVLETIRRQILARPVVHLLCPVHTLSWKPSWWIESWSRPVCCSSASGHGLLLLGTWAGGLLLVTSFSESQTSMQGRNGSTCTSLPCACTLCIAFSLLHFFVFISLWALQLSWFVIFFCMNFAWSSRYSMSSKSCESCWSSGSPRRLHPSRDLLPIEL